MILNTQGYLARAINETVAVRGGGISAMPSMHLGACSIYVLASRGTRWLFPSVIFWGVIFFGSVHFGYHYAVDGLVAALVALLCWHSVNRLFTRSAERTGAALDPCSQLSPTSFNHGLGKPAGTI